MDIIHFLKLLERCVVKFCKATAGKFPVSHAGNSMHVKTGLFLCGLHFKQPWQLKCAICGVLQIVPDDGLLASETICYSGVELRIGDFCLSYVGTYVIINCTLTLAYFCVGSVFDSVPKLH